MPTHDNLLTRATSLFADHPAIVDGQVRYTYAELVARVRMLAAAMLASGLQRGDRVGFVGRNSFRFIEVNLACWCAGLIHVPINFRLSPTEIEYIIADTGLRLLFAEQRYPSRAPATVTWSDDDDLDAANEYEVLLRSGVADPEGDAHAVTDDEVTEIFYTSGTTGQPKGVCLTHGNMAVSALDAVVSLQLGHDDRWLHASPMFHLVDAFAIRAITMVGGVHVISHFSPEQFGPLVQAEGITKTSLPPTLLDRIVREPATARSRLDSLRLISYGGSPMQDTVYRRCREVLGCSVLQAYGLTEGSGFVCHEVAADNPSPYEAMNTVGRPTLHVEIRLLDEKGNEVADGQAGEILIRGKRVFKQYWQKPQATLDAFDGGKWYSSGDLGRRDAQGRLQIVGRKKEMVISGGENIYPAEVQNVLLSVPGVVEAAVFGVPSEQWGEELRAVVYADFRDQVSLNEADILAYCRTRLGGYKLPKKITVVDEPLPKNGPGKIATNQIRALYITEEAKQ